MRSSGCDVNFVCRWNLYFIQFSLSWSRIVMEYLMDSRGFVLCKYTKERIHTAPWFMRKIFLINSGDRNPQCWLSNYNVIFGEKIWNTFKHIQNPSSSIHSLFASTTKLYVNTKSKHLFIASKPEAWHGENVSSFSSVLSLCTCLVELLRVYSKLLIMIMQWVEEWGGKLLNKANLRILSLWNLNLLTLRLAPLLMNIPLYVSSLNP